MSSLFLRDYSLQINDLLFSPSSKSRITFTVEKDNKRSPNKAKIEIYNLLKSRRDSLPQRSSVVLSAGYKGSISTIFSGRAKRILTKVDDVDTVLSIEAQDDGSGYVDANVSRTFSSNTSLMSVAKYIADQMGIGYGNLESQALTLQNGSSVFLDGVTIYGNARDQLDRIISSSGLRWSVQDGVLQVQRGAEPVTNQAIVLTPFSGLVGSPSRTQEGAIECKAKLISRIYPGCLVTIASREISGSYSVVSVKFSGDTHGDNWDTDLKLREY